MTEAQGVGGDERGPRRRRRAPARGGPKRTSANAFRPSATSDVDCDPARSVVEAAVETAYRVYEDYVRWGQQAAGQRSQSAPTLDWREPMSNRSPDMTETATQMMQMWQDMARMWMGYMMPFMPGAMAWPTPFGVSKTKAEGVELNVELDTSQSARVTFRLRQPPSNKPLQVRLVRDGGTEQLAFRFDSPTGLKMRINVPDKQASGTYRGVVLDDSGAEYGTMTLTLGSGR